MRLNNAQLREATLEWLDDPRGQKFNAAGDFRRLDRFINAAYQHLVNEIDRIPHAWSIQTPAEATDITTVSTTREYDLGLVCAVVDVVEPIDNAEAPIDVVPWSERDRVGSGVYLYRSSVRSSTTIWKLGVAVLPPSWATIRVYTLPLLEELTGFTSIPDSVPEDFHELIYYRAAMTGLMSVNRDPGAVAGLYSEGLVEMRLKLKKRITGSHRAPRLWYGHRRSRF